MTPRTSRPSSFSNANPLLPDANAFSPIPSCWKCGSALFSYDADERASSIVPDIISLESAILELMTGRSPNRTWARLSPDPAFVEKLRILIEDLTTPTGDRVPPFLQISMQIHSGVVTFSGGNVRRRKSRQCRGTGAFC